MRYIDGLDDYARDLEEFIDAYWLPAGWFAVSDHVAVKCADGMDFEYTLEDFEEAAEQISYIEMDGRRLATVKLLSSITVAELGDVAWVEIMEPRPEKVGKDVVGLEHMEFFYPDFGEVRDILRERGIAFEMQENPGHAWVNIVLNNKGQELKLNNKLLGDSVTEEIANGEAHISFQQEAL